MSDLISTPIMHESPDHAPAQYVWDGDVMRRAICPECGSHARADLLTPFPDSIGNLLFASPTIDQGSETLRRSREARALFSSGLRPLMEALFDAGVPSTLEQTGGYVMALRVAVPGTEDVVIVSSEDPDWYVSRMPRAVWDSEDPDHDTGDYPVETVTKRRVVETVQSLIGRGA